MEKIQKLSIEMISSDRYKIKFFADDVKKVSLITKHREQYFTKQDDSLIGVVNAKQLINLIKYKKPTRSRRLNIYELKEYREIVALSHDKNSNNISKNQVTQLMDLKEIYPDLNDKEINLIIDKQLTSDDIKLIKRVDSRKVSDDTSHDVILKLVESYFCEKYNYVLDVKEIVSNELLNEKFSLKSLEKQLNNYSTFNDKQIEELDIGFNLDIGGALYSYLSMDSTKSSTEKLTLFRKLKNANLNDIEILGFYISFSSESMQKFDDELASFCELKRKHDYKLTDVEYKYYQDIVGYSKQQIDEIIKLLKSTNTQVNLESFKKIADKLQISMLDPIDRLKNITDEKVLLDYFNVTQDDSELKIEVKKLEQQNKSLREQINSSKITGEALEIKDKLMSEIDELVEKNSLLVHQQNDLLDEIQEQEKQFILTLQSRIERKTNLNIEYTNTEDFINNIIQNIRGDIYISKKKFGFKNGKFYGNRSLNQSIEIRYEVGVEIAYDIVKQIPEDLRLEYLYKI